MSILRQRNWLLLAWLLSTLLAGCATQGVVASAHPTSGQGEVGRDIAVWIHTPTGPYTHFFGSLGASPAASEDVRPGIWVWVSGRLVEIRTRSLNADGFVCGDGEDEYEVENVDFPNALHWEELQMVEEDRISVLLPGGDFEAAQEVHDRIDVLATIGPFIAIRRLVSSYYPCSAHGTSQGSVFWVDLRDGSRLVLEGEIEVPDPQMERMRTHLVGEFRETFLERGDTEEEIRNQLGDGAGITISGVYPHLDDRRWKARLRITLGVAYAFSQGETSYAFETWGEMTNLPPSLDEFAGVPEEVQRFVAKHRGARLGGVSRRSPRSGNGLP